MISAKLTFKQRPGEGKGKSWRYEGERENKRENKSPQSRSIMSPVKKLPGYGRSCSKVLKETVAGHAPGRGEGACHWQIFGSVNGPEISGYF